MSRLRLFITPAIALAAIVAATLPGSAQPTPPTPPTPRTAPTPPPPPPAPVPRDTARYAEDVKRQALDQARREVARALEQIEQNQHIPPRTKAKLKAKLAKTLAKLATGKVDLEDLGDEMEAAFEDFGEELEGEIRVEVERQLRDRGVHVDIDDGDFDFDFDVDAPDPVTPAPGPRGPRGRITPMVPIAPIAPIDPVPLTGLDDGFDLDVTELKLSKDQRSQLKRIASEEKAALKPAQQRIRELSRQLRAAVERVDASEAELGSLVEQLSAEEAKVRKARILTLTRTRKLLTEAQRARVDR